VVVLAIEAVEGTGMIEHGEIVVSPFRPLGTGIAGITAPCAGWTDKAGHAIGRDGIIVQGEVPLMGPSSLQLSIPYLPKPAKTVLAFWNPAPVKTYVAGKALRIPRRCCGEVIGLATSGMDPGNLRPDFREMATDAVCTKPDDIGNGLARPFTETTPTHGASPSASQKGDCPTHDLFEPLGGRFRAKPPGRKLAYPFLLANSPIKATRAWTASRETEL